MLEVNYNHKEIIPKKNILNTITKGLLVVCLVSQLLCCRKEEDGYKIYKIKKGNHYCNLPKGNLPGSEEKFEFKFDESCLYDESLLEKSGRNKLYGIGGSPHENSARIAWRSKDGKIILAYYVYNEGERLDEIADTIDIGDINYGEVEYVRDSVKIDINGHQKIFPSKKPKVIFQEYPYFGGESTAPHDMFILIKKM